LDKQLRRLVCTSIQGEKSDSPKKAPDDPSNDHTSLVVCCAALRYQYLSEHEKAAFNIHISDYVSTKSKAIVVGRTIRWTFMISQRNRDGIGRGVHI